MTIDRTQLKAAHVAFNEAKDKVATLEGAIERSKAALADAEEKLHQVAVSGGNFVQQRLEQLKSGQSLTSLASIKRVTRYQAEEEIDLAKTAHQTLESELAHAKADLKRAGDIRRWEATRVAFKVAEPLVAELSSLNQRRRDLRRALAGLANHPDCDHKPADVALPFELPAALADPEPHMPGLLRDAMWQRWSKRIDALIDNPDADLAEPPAIREEDSIIFVPDIGQPQFRGYRVL